MEFNESAYVKKLKKIRKEKEECLDKLRNELINFLKLIETDETKINNSNLEKITDRYFSFVQERTKERLIEEEINRIQKEKGIDVVIS